MSLAASEPERLAFETTVEDGGQEIVLAETYFYPEGGGQPADRGTIAGREVLDVRKRDGRIVHTIDGTLSDGDAVDCAIDPEFRRYCMRAHTASHVLYGAGRRLFKELGYGGFDISAPPQDRRGDDETTEKVRVDFATPTDIDDETLVAMEGLVNRCVWDSRAVSWEELPREEALAREEIAFNTKTEEGISGETVRVVTIDGWDTAACGGTHVRDTAEIGPVSVLERSNPGEGLTRVEFAVGPAAIDHRSAEKQATLEVAAALDTAVTELPEAVERLKENYAALEAERDALRERLLDAEIAALSEEAFERDGHTWIAGVLSADGDVLAERVRKLPEDIDVFVLATPEGRVAVGTNGEVDAGDVVAEITGEFGGGGGGSPTAAQAGGLSVDGEAVVSYLRR